MFGGRRIVRVENSSLRMRSVVRERRFGRIVDEGLDSGPIVLQEAVPVLGSDTADSLSARILETEHRIYPRAVRLMLEGRCRVEGRRVIVEGE